MLLRNLDIDDKDKKNEIEHAEFERMIRKLEKKINVVEYLIKEHINEKSRIDQST